MVKKVSEKTMSVLSQIQNLSASEQGELNNALRQLQVNSSDDQMFTNVTKAMQAAGWNPLKRAKAGVRTWAHNKAEATKGINSRTTARVARFFGLRKTADFMDRWLTGPKPPKSVIKNTAGITADNSSGEESSGGTLIIITKQLNYVTERVDRIGEDVTDIKSLLMPKFVTANGATGTADEGDQQVAMFNPLAPQGKQFGKIDDRSGKLVGKTGANFKSSAEEKSALETAKLAFKIYEKDKARVELKKKYEYKDEEEQSKKEDTIEGLKQHIDDKIEEVKEEMPKEKKGIFGMFLNVVPLLMPFLTMLGKIGLVGLGAFLVAKIGEWIWDNVGVKFLEMIRDVRDKILEWKDAIAKKFIEWKDGIIEWWENSWMGQVLGKIAEHFKLKWEKKEEENKAAGRTRGGIASSKGSDPQTAIDHYDKLANDQSLTPEARAANATARDTLMKAYKLEPTQKQETQETIPAEIAAEGSDTVDTNYANIPVAPTVVTTPTNTGGVGGELRTTKPPTTRDLLAQIAKGEGTSDADAMKKGYASGYDVTLGYGAYHKPLDKPLSKMTLGEVRKVQTEMLNHPKNKLNSSAVGKYQIVRATLFGKGKDYPKGGLVGALGLKDSDVFNGELQDKLAGKLLEWRGLNKFQRGQLSNEEFQANLSKEWASIADPNTGKSAYGQHTGTKTEDIAPIIAGMNNVTPTPTLPGATVDKESRVMQASNAPSSVTIMGAPTVVNNNNVNNTVAKRPAVKADVLAKDDSLVRTTLRDTQHPAYAG